MRDARRWHTGAAAASSNKQAGTTQILLPLSSLFFAPQGEAKGPAGVITAAAKRSRAEEGPTVTAAQIALMGGQWRPNADDE